MTKLRPVDIRVLITLLKLSPNDMRKSVTFMDIYDQMPTGTASESTVYAVLREFQRRGWVSIQEMWRPGEGQWEPPTRVWEYRFLGRGRRAIERLLARDWFTQFQAQQMKFVPSQEAGDASTSDS